MTKPYSSPPTNLRSLRDRLTQVAERQGVVFGRLQRHVAMIVVAQFAATLTDDTGAPLLLVKGGSSLELRREFPIRGPQRLRHGRTSRYRINP